MKKKLAELLEHREKLSIIDNARVSSAVLLPLFEHEGRDHIVFIKRTETVREHKGQISFPGGSCEKEDGTLLDTALRESWEEIGLLSGDVTVLGELDDEVTTTSNFVVTPFVGMIPWPYDFVMNPDEVDDIFNVPIPSLLEEGCLQPDTETLNGKIVTSCKYLYEGRVIWGATARILNRFLEIYCRAL